MKSALFFSLLIGTTLLAQPIDNHFITLSSGLKTEGSGMVLKRSVLSVAQSPAKEFSPLPKHCFTGQWLSSSTFWLAGQQGPSGYFRSSTGLSVEYGHRLKGPCMVGVRLSPMRGYGSSTIHFIGGWVIPADAYLRTRLLSFGKKARTQCFLTTGLSAEINQYWDYNRLPAQQIQFSAGGLLGLRTLVHITRNWAIAFDYDYRFVKHLALQRPYGFLDNSANLGVQYSFHK